MSPAHTTKKDSGGRPAVFLLPVHRRLSRGWGRLFHQTSVRWDGLDSFVLDSLARISLDAHYLRDYLFALRFRGLETPVNQEFSLSVGGNSPPPPNGNRTPREPHPGKPPKKPKSICGAVRAQNRNRKALVRSGRGQKDCVFQSDGDGVWFCYERFFRRRRLRRPRRPRCARRPHMRKAPILFLGLEPFRFARTIGRSTPQKKCPQRESNPCYVLERDVT